MGIESVLQVSGFKVHAASTSSSSVKDCTLSAAAAHGHIQGAAESLSRKNVRHGRTCLLTTQNSPPSKFVDRTRNLCVPLCAQPSSSPSTRDENGGGTSASFAVMQSTMLHLRNSGIIACLRSTSAAIALDAARAALDGGLAVVEVTMTTPSAAGVIESLVREYPSATIGAGTILSMHDAEKAKQAGAKFLASPVTVEEMVRVHRDGPVLFIPWAMTPTEVVSAYNMGAHAVKLFPVSVVGDIRFVLALRKTLGHIPLIPSNGIPLGVMAAIVSDGVFEKSALENRDFNRIRTLASFAVSKSLLCKINPK